MEKNVIEEVTQFVSPEERMRLVRLCTTLPTDLEDAARIDGSSRLGTLWSIVIPMIIPGVVAVGFSPSSTPGMSCFLL